MRAEWSLCVVFKKIIAFADYLALHDNTDGRARNAIDVCSVPSRDKCTRFRGNPASDELPPLVLPWVGVRGLSMKLPKILYYLGSECVHRKHFKDVDPEKFEFISEFEMVQAFCCALFVDYRQGQVWILEESAIEFFENNSKAPDILTPGVVSLASASLHRPVARRSRYPFSSCGSASNFAASIAFDGLLWTSEALPSRRANTTGPGSRVST